jgi:uncharacterized membrane protein YphA (DoxX/SURF4 family)
MVRILVSLVVILHGLVHLLYFGQSARLFELQPGMGWPDGSWAFSRLLGEKATRLLAGVGCVLAAMGFVLGGVAIMLGPSWGSAAVAASAVISGTVFIVFWDGKPKGLDRQGAIGVLIDVVFLAGALGPVLGT